MVDWMSPKVIAEDGFIFLKFMHVLVGLYCWEWFVSLDFDWQYISGKRKFRWPMVFYFLNRYLLLFSLIGIIVALNVTTPIDCQVLYTFNQLLGNMTIGLVSINLSIRTMAVWGQRWYIVVPLIFIILGHWSILFHGVLLKAQWNPNGGGCVITHTNRNIISATFIYSMCFDFVVLCLTAYKLHHYLRHTGQSRISILIFHDGLLYFIVAFLANLVAVTFVLLNLNPVMSIIGAVPAAIASTIVACRAVRRLANFMSVGADVYHGSISRQTHPAGQTKVSNATPSISVSNNGGVQIQVQSYQQFDVQDEPGVSGNEYKSQLEF